MSEIISEQMGITSEQKMTGIISEKNLKRIEKFRKYLLRVAIWTLIAGIVLGAVMILVSDPSGVSEMVGKTMGTIFLAALMMILCVNSFYRLESQDKTVQIFAVVAIWFPDVLAACWWDEGACSKYLSTHKGTTYYYDDARADGCPKYIGWECAPSIFAKIATIASCVSAFGFLASNIMSMYEGRRKDILKPLKIASTALVGYVCLWGCMAICARDFYKDPVLSKLSALAGFASGIWLIMVVLTWIISHIERNKAGLRRGERGRPDVEANAADAGVDTTDKRANAADTGGGANVAATDTPLATQPIDEKNFATFASYQPKSDAELRAEIEEKVRREMIEKEVCEKLAKEMAKQKELERETLDDKLDLPTTDENMPLKEN